MPCARGGRNGFVDNVADAQSLCMSKRSLENCKMSPKDPQVSAILLRNSEQRCIIYWLPPDTPLFLAHFGGESLSLFLLQGHDCRNHMISGADFSANGLESLGSQPSFIVQLDLHKERSKNLLETTGFEKFRLTSGANTLRQFRSRIKRKNSGKSSSTYSASCILSDNSSPVVSDSSTVVDTYIFKEDIPKVEKPVTKSSRKKGKKKGKQNKRSSKKKPSIGAASYTGGGMDSVSIGTGLACSVDHIAGSNKSNKETCRSCVSTNSHLEEDKSCSEKSSTSSLQGAIVGSLRDGWISDLSEACSNDVETQSSGKDEYGRVSPQSSADSGTNGNASPKDCVSSGFHSDAVESHGEERVHCSSDACSSNDFHPVVYGKKGRRSAKKTTDVVNLGNRRGAVNTNARSGKAGNHSVWQKVQKEEPEDSKCNNNSSKVNSKPLDTASRCPEKRVSGDRYMCPRKSNSEKLDSQLHREKSTSSFLDVNRLTEGNMMKDAKRRQDLIVNQVNEYSRKGLDASVSNLRISSKIHTKHKDELEISHNIEGNKIFKQALGVPCGTSSERLMTMPSNEPHLEQGQKVQIQLVNVTPGSDCSNVHILSSCAEQHGMQSLPEDTRIENHYQHSQSKHESSIYFHSTDGKDNSSIKSDTCKCPASTLQKWVPVGRKNHVPFKAGDELVKDSPNLENMEVQQLSSDQHSQGGCGSEISSSTSGDADCEISEVDEVSKRSHPHLEQELAGFLSECKCHVTNKKDQCPIGANDDLGLLRQAVVDAYCLKTASENVRHVTGHPIAEFERFLHCASPILGEACCATSCETCPQEKVVDSLCLHQLPDSSLGCIWKWYERPSCYGLEVTAEDSNTRSSSLGHSEFRAYFVPYLSAVQLFIQANRSAGGCGCNREQSEADSTSGGRTNSKFLPIFSKLVPQPSEVVSQSCSFDKEDICSESTRGHCTDKELLFEYFEADQPYERRSLFEKIKELVKGDALSSRNMFGDPSNLASLNLSDLHPASWYCVAWYPIYRIPDGNLRAAFLTYHSLGHFTCRKGPRSSSSRKSLLTVPVVGLQSYNAKSECWFQPRPMRSAVVQTEASPYSDASEILKERLRTLEQTASLMARAPVVKGKQRCVNRQPDYEFFLTRKL